ncbi:hypothetical protein XM57_27875 [Burkholderia cepacia]|nr:hypothetical protein XM57_27875 [Burkholderia cepacia]
MIVSDNFRPSIIDVAILVDAPRIKYYYGANHAKDNVNFSDYVGVGNNGDGGSFIYMVTTWRDAQNEGGSELSIYGEVRNKIRWRMRSLSMGGIADAMSRNEPPVAFQAAIRGFVFSGGDAYKEYITTPVKKTETVKSWGFDQNGNLVQQDINDTYWESEVIKPGFGNQNNQRVNITYHTPFNILCNCQDCNDGTHGGGGGGGNGCGGYTYDPFIVTQG